MHLQWEEEHRHEWKRGQDRAHHCLGNGPENKLLDLKGEKENSVLLKRDADIQYSIHRSPNRSGPKLCRLSRVILFLCIQPCEITLPSHNTTGQLSPRAPRPVISSGKRLGVA